MNYDNAVKLIKNNYNTQEKLIISSLSYDAIITLGKLQTQNINRTMTDQTILKLSSMQPHQQAGYLSNPLLQFMIQQCSITMPSTSINNIQTNNVESTENINHKVNLNNNNKHFQTNTNPRNLFQESSEEERGKNFFETLEFF